MVAAAAGVFRRTDLERQDQQVAWNRHDQAFFAAGACHILAWSCRKAYPDLGIATTALRFAGDTIPSHVFAVWKGWAFDHSGWNPVDELVSVNERFERRVLEELLVIDDMGVFCRAYRFRLPDQFWRDPRPRAARYLRRFDPVWPTAEGR